MSNNALYSDNIAITSVGNTLNGFQKRINNVGNNQNYEEILQAVKTQINSTEKSSSDMAMNDYKEYINDRLQITKRKLMRYQNDETEDFWTQRLKRMKKRFEMEQEMFDNLYELKQISKHKAEVKSAQMEAEGLIDTSNPMPVITGIPAKYLLSMLEVE